MTADLVLLSVAFAFMAAGFSWMAIQVKRACCRWFSEALDGVAAAIR